MVGFALPDKQWDVRVHFIATAASECTQMYSGSLGSVSPLNQRHGNIDSIYRMLKKR
jgi:hypothetical protein